MFEVSSILSSIGPFVNSKSIEVVVLKVAYVLVLVRKPQYPVSLSFA